MTKRRAFWIAAFAAVGAAVAVATPGSPVYLPTIVVAKGRHGGQPTHYWLRRLNSPDARIRHEAISMLSSIGSEAAEAVPVLGKILTDDPDRDVRNQAALAMSKMVPASAVAVPQLGHALDDEELFVRMNAAIALLRLGGSAGAAMPALIKAVKDDANRTNLGTFHATIQEMAALALGRAGSGNSEAVATLTEFLRGADTAEMRTSALHALGDVGSAAQPAAPLMRQMLNDANSVVRDAAAQALKNTGVPAGTSNGNLAKADDDFELPEAERAYLWDIEHHGNVLVKHGFAALADALKRSDAAALARLLADDFTGTDLRAPQRIRSATGSWEVERLKPTDQDKAGQISTPLGRDAFIARLLEWRRIFAAAPPSVKFSLMNLGPKTRKQMSGAWEGTALLRLYGEYAAGAPAEVALILRYEVPQPTPERFNQPGWLRGAAVLQVLTAKAPSYLFTEVARKRGLDVDKVHDNWNAPKFHPATGGAYVCDFNRDGILDLLITDVQSTSLYQGQPDGRFTDVTSRCGLPTTPQNTTLAAWIDIDGDGWEDLILAGLVFRNDRGQRFADAGKTCNLRLPIGAGNIAVADYDKDGKLDLYVTRTGPPGGRSWLDDKSSDPKGNYLFRNKGNWQFEDVTRASGAFGGRRSSFTAAWLDANNDGWPDLHVPNEFGDGVLLINNGDGTFRERPLADRPADYGTMGMAVGDVNNDGHIDLYCNNMFSKAGTRVIGNLAADAFPPKVMEKMRRFVAGSQLHLNQGDLKFTQAGPEKQVAGVGWAYGACLADLDNDGWLDIYATAGFISKSRDRPDG